MSTSRNGDPAATEPVMVTLIAWRRLNAAHSRVSRELTAALRRQHGLSINAHAVLAELVRAPDHKLRMTEIAHRIDFSLSGLTGLVGRLEQDGLVERQSNFADRRVIYARLTDVGAQYAREADAKHRETLDSLFSTHYDATEIKQLTSLLHRLAHANGRADHQV